MEPIEYISIELSKVLDGFTIDESNAIKYILRHENGELSVRPHNVDLPDPNCGCQHCSTHYFHEITSSERVVQLRSLIESINPQINIPTPTGPIEPINLVNDVAAKAIKGSLKGAMSKAIKHLEGSGEINGALTSNMAQGAISGALVALVVLQGNLLQLILEYSLRK